MKTLIQKPFLTLSAFAIFSAAYATYTTVTQSIRINGRDVPGQPKIIAGQTYIPLASLMSAGGTAEITPERISITIGPTGGANQTTALEGKINDWLFNGIWRFRVTGVTPNDDGRPGWKVSVELKNGTRADNLALDGTGIDSLRLIMADGNGLTAYNSVDLTSKGIGPAASTILSLLFYDDEGGGRRPDRLVLLIKPDTETTKYMRRLSIGYTTPDPSFRIKLTP